MSTTSWQGITALSTALPVLCTITVGLRFHARIRQKADLEFDDWAQIPSLLLFIGMCITCLIGVANKAIGYPDPPGPPTVAAPSTILCEKLIYALQIIQLVALSIIKITALAFYRRVFCSVRPSPMNTIIWILIIITTAWGIGFIGFYAGGCGRHPAAAWQGNLPFLEYCIDLTPKFEKSFAISDFILDTFVLAVPLPSVGSPKPAKDGTSTDILQIWKLRMTNGRKIGVTGIFMLALIGYGACTARVATVIILSGKTFSQTAPDIQTSDTEAIWFSMLETGFTLIAVNLPSLWSIISNFSPESIVRSVRSLISLRSMRSDGSHDGSSTRPYPRKNSSSTQGIELVAPEDTADFSITVETQKSKDTAYGYHNDLENGIHVQKTVQQASKERA
ncbi:hypothetical protein HYFRA_00009463 [Hymenoscyphus fraxineus]|uniref:Rhodopsin domain-containing protein n=1 Tax=Hymenoscyphus fraxineus TaxID=746836 RepID=A0A9N9KX41_9HELO|nr:hypothetical protein HYFRA_00009463 [Hymenoscyphus fraxineus]